MECIVGSGDLSSDFFLNRRWREERDSFSPCRQSSNIDLALGSSSGRFRREIIRCFPGSRTSSAS